MTKAPEICVAGGGLSGRLTALALAHSGFAVTLVDRQSLSAAPDDGRTTALAYAGVRMLIRLGVWDALLPKAQPITDIVVSNGEPRDRFRPGKLSGGQLHFPATLLSGERMPADAPALGYIVENRDLLAALGEALAPAGVTIREGVSIIDYDAAPSRGRGRLRLQGGEVLEPLLLIACDGKRSPLRAAMNIKTMGWDYGQSAIIVNLTHEKPHHGTAHEIFYPDGPFAILPMQGNNVSIVWTEKRERVRSYLALDEAAFLAAARERVGDHLGALSLASPRQSYPLSFLYAPKLTAERFALAGDAGHGIHPIAGQGFNLGIKDIAALCDVLSEARDTGLDIGHGAVLARYDSWRRFDTAALAFGTDALVRLFSNDFGPLKQVRGLGLGIVQRSDMARRFFMRVSGADLGDLPGLMQPL
ncbi:MAG: UbiH/UbiF/VisC/COQ6 family ubiquinone biosynthesis hydroxylase [Parvularcula sp.]|jgi:2-octaprenyl-6-methoxyphenol hydroxylase|nr:UbiH/UbiF/VisC/COQ6 family ubiquinone biosynthesis hydroxylase [Parvularcula sp.]